MPVLNKKIIIVIVWLVVSEQLMSELLFPFAPFMVADFHITTDGDIGYFVGLIASAFGFAQVISCIFWGWLSDKYGRKKFLVIGCLANALTISLFGYSGTYWEAIVFHSITGILCGNGAIIRGVIGDVTDSKNASTAWAAWAFATGIGRMVATVIGGVFCRPGLTWPGIFASGTLFVQKPYLLPCFIAAGICVVGMVVTVMLLPETLDPDHSTQISIFSTIPGINNADETITYSRLPTDDIPPSPASSMRSSKVKEGFMAITHTRVKPLPRKEYYEDTDDEMVAMAPKGMAQVEKTTIFMLFVIQMLMWITQIVYDEIFTLWTSQTMVQGGLGWSPVQVGIYFAGFGAEIVVCSLIIYPILAKYVTPLVLFRIGCLAATAFFAAIPFASYIQWISNPALWAYLMCISFLFTTATGISSPSLAIIINNTAPSANLLGRINGILQTAVGVARVIGPTAGGSLVAWSLNNNLGFPFDYHFTFFTMALVSVLVLMLSCVFNPSVNDSKRKDILRPVMRVETYSDDEHLIA